MSASSWHRKAPGAQGSARRISNWAEAPTNLAETPTGWADDPGRAGSPLADLANFLRYERSSRHSVEPHLFAGYLDAGGQLPEDWRRLSRVVDLTALCGSPTRKELPDGVVAELVELVRATVEERDQPAL